MAIKICLSTSIQSREIAVAEDEEKSPDEVDLALPAVNPVS